MSAPTVPAQGPRVPAVHGVVWMSGLGTGERHAIRHWRSTANGKVGALCGVTSVFWSADCIIGDGRVCRVCVSRLDNRGQQ